MEKWKGLGNCETQFAQIKWRLSRVSQLPMERFKERNIRIVYEKRIQKKYSKSVFQKYFYHSQNGIYQRASRWKKSGGMQYVFGILWNDFEGIYADEPEYG